MAPDLDTGHVEQVGDEPVQALGFVLQGGQQFLALGGTVPFRKAAQARHGAEDRGERCAQIVRDRGQQRGTQTLGLGQHPASSSPLASEMRSIATAPDRITRRAGAARPGSATAPAYHGRYRARPRARFRCATARTGVFRRVMCRRPDPRGDCAPRSIAPPPCPRCRAGPRADSPMQHQAHRPLSPASGGPCELSASTRSGRRSPTGDRQASPMPATLRLKAYSSAVVFARNRAVTTWVRVARRQIADNDCYNQKEEKRQDIFGIPDGKGVERRKKKEIVGQHARNGGEQRWPQAPSDRRAKYCRQKYQRDALDIDELLQEQADTRAAATAAALPR